MEYPAVSIIVITYNEEKHIRPCLDSILSIDYPEGKYEIIIVDSGRDKTAEIVKGYSKVKLIRSNEKNFALSRNIGVRGSQNEVIAFTDADCVVPPNWLKILVRSLDSERIGGVGGNAFPPEESSRLGRWIACLGLPAGGSIGLDANIKETERGVNSLSTCNVIYRKSALEEVGGFDEALKWGEEDTEIAERIRKRGYFLKYEPASYVYHRTWEGFRDFIAWNLRRGLAQRCTKNVNFLRLLFDPFSPVWLFTGIIIMLIIGFPIALAIPVTAWAILSMVMFVGTKKFRLLMQRRHSAKISLFTLMAIIPVFFYLRRLTMNCAQWGVKLHGIK